MRYNVLYINMICNLRGGVFWHLLTIFDLENQKIILIFVTGTEIIGRVFFDKCVWRIILIIIKNDFSTENGSAHCGTV